MTTIHEEIADLRAALAFFEASDVLREQNAGLYFGNKSLIISAFEEDKFAACVRYAGRSRTR